MKHISNEGLENAPKVMQDFALQLQYNKCKKVNNNHFINKHNKTIISVVEKPYNFIKWLLILSVIVALIVEQVSYYA